MNQLDLERQKAAEGRARKAFIRYSPLISTALVIGMAALPVMGEARPQRRAEQCSASVQTGSIPSLTTNGRRVTLLNAPLMRENSYLSVTLPESYMTRLRTAAAGRPEGERQGMVADILQNNIQIAYARVGSGTRATFDCAPLDGTLPEAATAAVPSSSARATPSARPSASAVPSARPADSSDPLSRVQPAPTSTASPAPSSDVPQDAGAPQQRRRSIQP